MKICIDAGHNFSLFDTGANGVSYNEQTLTFLIAEKLKYILEKNGIEVIMTRNKLTDNIGKSLNDSLLTRAKIANNAKCDFFISVHINAGGGKGAETYVYSDTGASYEKAVKIQDAFEKEGRINRGVKVRSFSVLKNTKMPALLVECGFIDNKDEEMWIAKNTEKIAKIISSAFISNVKYTEFDEALNILCQKNIISQKEKWIENANVNEDIKWLIIKSGTYLKNM
jgi:N-acetylmuramoyl-L-alanine amidase